MLKTVSSITNAIGALNYKGTWDANANSPALASSVGTKGDYYVVGTAGTTNLNGISNWGVGDLATFNGSVWQRVEGGADGNFVNLSATGTSSLAGLTILGTGKTISGDFSNATETNRLAFQDSTTNAGTQVNAITNGTGTESAFNAYSGSAINNVSRLRLGANSAAGVAFIESSRVGTGTFLPLIFSTNNAEQVRLDTSGFFIRGGTSQSFGLLSSQTTSAGGFAIGAQTSGAGAALYGGWSSTTAVYTVFGNGNVVNTNNSYGPISDVKLKENIVDATPKLDELMKVRIVNYNLKQELGFETHKQIGVVAQELEQIFPGLVDSHIDKDQDGNELNTQTKSVKMTVFIPILIKAIQEQQQIIEQLKAKVGL